MAPGIHFDDRAVWDDSALLNSWEDAVDEYKKYHSIAKSGKRLEDVLTKEELEQLQGDYGDLLDKETTSGKDVDMADSAEIAHAHAQAQENGVEPSGMGVAKAEDRTASVGQADTMTGTEQPHDGCLPNAMAQAVLGSVQDEKLKNLMMSWYYTGYYTGLVAGQQKRTPGTGSSPSGQ